MQIHYLGIRHHGPGCTRNLMLALKRIKPDLLLLEMPADSREALELVANPKLKPPVALLMYNPDNPQRASFYPYAEFSPEWQAISYCLKNNTELRCFDLPKENWLALGTETDEVEAETAESEEDDSIEETIDQQASQIRRDPLGYIGEIAGYADGERWWEEVMEKQSNDTQLFEGILELMTALRTELNFKESEETYLREAKMRTTMREAEKDGFQNVVVVCGAWHTPALLEYKKTEKDDEKLLKKLKKVAVKHTWVPWTYERLSVSSGYGAGIVSPAWYEMLYKQKREKILVNWMTRAAQLLRKEDMDASSAHVIEAVRLSHTLSSLRERHLPGLEEMMEASVAIFGGGYPEAVKMIEKELIVGEKMGAIPKELKTNPLQEDLEKQVKKLRLKMEPEKKVVEWDLRKANDLEKSRLLHRLNMLGINWGKVAYGSSKSRLSSLENWTLRWKPEMTIAVIEAGIWGNTIKDATTNFSLNKLQNSQEITELTALLKDCLRADVSKIISPLLKKLENLASVSKDMVSLMDALPNFVDIARYTATDVRKTDTESVNRLLMQIIPRICISLPNICISLDNEAANDMWGRIQKAHQAILTYNVPEITEEWYESIEKIAVQTQTDGKLSGGTNRMLLDAQKQSLEITQNGLSQALSSGNEAMFSVRWLDGFLMDNITILLYNPNIVGIINDWLSVLTEDAFREYVALMRKVFSRFSIPERQKIFALILHGVSATSSISTPKNTQMQPTPQNPERAALIKTVFEGWLAKIYG